MCFPRLNSCFCGCSLRTGILLYCWINMMWNICGLIWHIKPLIIEFVAYENDFHLKNDQISTASQMFHLLELIVTVLAIIGVYSKKTCFLNPMVGIETLTLLLYFLITLCMINKLIQNEMQGHVIQMCFILGIRYYIYLVIISFYYEIMHGRDGRSQEGWIVNQQQNLFFPPTAPNVAELPTDNHHYVDAVPTAAAATAVHTGSVNAAAYSASIDQQHHQFVSQQPPHNINYYPPPMSHPYPYAPPPYPYPPPPALSQPVNENPPPYAP